MIRRRYLPAARYAGFLLGAVLCLASPRASRGFEVFRHANMAEEVLATQGVPGTVLSLIKQGTRQPDMNGCTQHCYCPSWLQWIAGCEPDSATIIDVLSPDHFDNNRRDESVANVLAKIQFARNVLLGLAAADPLPAGWQQDFDLAMIVFGEALHTVQDFYAHSNWIECQKDLVRIGGHLTDMPMWNGVDWGCSTDIGGVQVSGLQTGYVDITPPAGSVTHAALNKDSPSSPQGAIEIRRIFPPGLIATYYETASGQLGGTFNAYSNDGVAPRHVIRAWEAVLYDTAVYSAVGKASGQTEGVTAANAAAAISIQQLLAVAAADSSVQATAQRIEDLLANWDVNDPDAYPYDAFDANGLPLDPVSSVPAVDITGRLDQNFPNPFNPVTTIRFHLARPERVRLEIYDTGGRRVRTILDEALAADDYSAVWDGRGDDGKPVAAGTYAYVLRTGDWRRSQKMVLVK